MTESWSEEEKCDQEAGLMQEEYLLDKVTIIPLGLEFSLETWAKGWNFFFQ
jgi:hypothetical protein